MRGQRRLDVVTNIQQVSSAWLTEALRSSGALVGGAVAGFTVVSGGGNWSSNARLTLHYTADSTGDLPRRLFLKLVSADLGDGEYFGPSEVDLYTRDYVDISDAPLLRCYHAAYSAELHRYHLLLDDISDTHIEAAHQTPDLAYGLALADALATLHARWWGAERLAAASAPIHSSEHIRRFVAIAAPGAEYITAGHAANLKPHWPPLMRDLFAYYPQALVDRTHNPNGFTLIHGDAGKHNILVPRRNNRPIYLIDRQPFDWSLTTWLGVYDLAYIMALDWESDIRRRLEAPILQRYHAQLLARGVEDYPWDQLWYDYRLSIPLCVTVAAEYCRGGVNAHTAPTWLPMLLRALTTCDDLACAELW